MTTELLKKERVLGRLEQKQITIPDSVMVQLIEGQSVLLNTESELYFGLDQTGTVFWQALSEQPTLQEALSVLKDMFEVDETQIESDFRDFISKLIEYDLLRIQ